MKKLKIKIVVANYYKEITDPLIQSCIEILEPSGKSADWPVHGTNCQSSRWSGLEML